MDMLKDWFLAITWTATSIPARVRKKMRSAAKAVKALAPQVINELVSQSWTVFGLLVGWIVLPDGDTRDFVGVVLLWLCIAWLVTMPLRISRED